MGSLKLKRNEQRRGRTGDVGSDVLVDGVVVGYVTKRSEWYGNIGHRGARYYYFDFYKLVEGQQRGEKIASDSTRKRVVAEALVALGYPDAARESDADHARFHIRKLETA